LSVTRFNTTNPILHFGGFDVKKKKKTVYIGGEMDRSEEIMAKSFEKFIDKKTLLFILLLLLLLVLVMMK